MKFSIRGIDLDRTSLRRDGTRLLWMALIAGGLASGGGGAASAQPMAEPAASDRQATRTEDAGTTVTVELGEPRDPETVIARTELGPITVEDVASYYETWEVPIEPQVPPEAVARMPAAWLERLAQIYGIARLSAQRMERQMAEEAVEPPLTIEQLPPARREFEEWMIGYVMEELTRREIMEKVGEPTDEEIQEYYEAHRQEYFEPASYAFRQLFLQTFKPYTVKPGDTLEKIAERESGDAGAIENIRLDAPSRPRPWVAPEDRERQLFNPLNVGEELLAPMTEEEAAAVRERMEALVERVEGGESFAQVAAEASEDGLRGEVVSPFPSGFTPFIEGIGPALEATDPGGMSEIFRSVNGWHVVQVINETPGGYRDLAEVRGQISELLKQERQEELDQALSRRLFASEAIEVEYEALEQAPDLEANEIVLTIGGRAFTWGDFRSTWEKRLGPGASREAMQDAVRYLPQAQFALALMWAEETGLWDEAEAAEYRGDLQTAIYAKNYFEQELQERAEAQVTEEMIRETYEANAERFMTPELVSYEIIEMKPGGAFAAQMADKKRAELERLRASLNAELEGVETLRDFRVLADEISLSEAGDEPDPMRGATELTGNDVDARMLRGETAAQVRALEPGEWSDAYIDGEVVRAVALTDRKASRPVPVAEVRDSIRRQLVEALKPSVGRQLSAELTDELQFQPVLRDNDAGSG